MALRSAVRGPKESIAVVCLITERLQLRLLRVSDAEEVAAIAGDWRVARMMGDMPHPMCPQRAAIWIMDRRAGSLVLAVVTRADRRLIGSVSHFPLAPGIVEIGYWLGAAHWGHGYAPEAVREVIRYGFTSGRVREFRATHVVDNRGSWRVLDRLGFVACGSTTVWSEARQARVQALCYRLEHQRALELSLVDSNRDRTHTLAAFSGASAFDRLSATAEAASS
jgi:RimJ/RimL family protein N-acetyltransferase